MRAFVSAYREFDKRHRRLGFIDKGEYYYRKKYDTTWCEELYVIKATNEIRRKHPFSLREEPMEWEVAEFSDLIRWEK